jgi:uncharacterized PurR-regulated membrane protein YhhQ (DUF165 family)
MPSNNSNMASSLIDSAVFVLIALHFLPLQEQIKIIGMMSGAKVLGGAVWAWILTRKRSKGKTCICGTGYYAARECPVHGWAKTY